MRRLLSIIAILLAVGLVAGPAMADQRIPGFQPKFNFTPKIVKKPNIKVPLIAVIPPSVAINNALALMPDAKALGVQLKGSLYIVKLKNGNQVIKVGVDAVSGAVSP